MKAKFTLTKLSSGDRIYLGCDDAYVVAKNLEMYCCKDCIKEAKREYFYDTDSLDTQEEYQQYLYELMGTACGAEFFLEEPEEGEDNVEKN